MERVADLTRDAFAVVRDLRVLGGDGLAVSGGSLISLVFLPEEALIVGQQRRLAEIPYSEIVALEIGGPGERKTGGGFMGGGFGAEGAAEGMLIASALNMLTTRTKVETVVCLQTRTAELFLHCSRETPDALRMRLSRVFTILRSRPPETAQLDTAPPSTIDQIGKLADMLEKGLLTREEFEAMKRSTLSGLET
jgi:Short C-terminal domain